MSSSNNIDNADLNDSNVVTYRDEDGVEQTREMTAAEAHLRNHLDRVRTEYIEEGGLEADVLARIQGQEGNARQNLTRIGRNQRAGRIRRSQRRDDTVNTRRLWASGSASTNASAKLPTIVAILAILVILLVLATEDAGSQSSGVNSLGSFHKSKKLRNSALYNNDGSVYMYGDDNNNALNSNSSKNNPISYSWYNFWDSSKYTKLDPQGISHRGNHVSSIYFHGGFGYASDEILTIVDRAKELHLQNKEHKKEEAAYNEKLNLMRDNNKLFAYDDLVQACAKVYKGQGLYKSVFEIDIKKGHLNDMSLYTSQLHMLDESSGNNENLDLFQTLELNGIGHNGMGNNVIVFEGNTHWVLVDDVVDDDNLLPSDQYDLVYNALDNHGDVYGFGVKKKKPQPIKQCNLRLEFQVFGDLKVYDFAHVNVENASKKRAALVNDIKTGYTHLFPYLENSKNAHKIGRWLLDTTKKKEHSPQFPTSIVFGKLISDCNELNDLVFLGHPYSMYGTDLRITFFFFISTVNLFVSLCCCYCLFGAIETDEQGIKYKISKSSLMSLFLLKGVETALYFNFGITAITWNLLCLIICGISLIIFVIYSRLCIDCWRYQMLAEMQQLREQNTSLTSEEYHELLKAKVTSFLRLIAVVCLAAFILIKPILSEVPEFIFFLAALPSIFRLRKSVNKGHQRSATKTFVILSSISTLGLPFLMFGAKRSDNPFDEDTMFQTVFDGILLPSFTERAPNISKFIVGSLCIGFLVFLELIGHFLGPRWFVPVGILGEDEIFNYHKPPKIKRSKQIDNSPQLHPSRSTCDLNNAERGQEHSDVDEEELDDDTLKTSNLGISIFMAAKRPKDALFGTARIMKEGVRGLYEGLSSSLGTQSESPVDGMLERKNNESFDESVANTNQIDSFNVELFKMFENVELPKQASYYDGGMANNASQSIEVVGSIESEEVEPTFFNLEEHFYITDCVICMFPLYLPWQKCETSEIESSDLVSRRSLSMVCNILAYLEPLALYLYRQRRIESESVQFLREAQVKYGNLQGVKVDWANTPCEHLFHETCLRDWTAVKCECPTCRAIIPPFAD